MVEVLAVFGYIRILVCHERCAWLEPRKLQAEVRCTQGALPVIMAFTFSQAA